jgi:hypothetical protein
MAKKKSGSKKGKRSSFSGNMIAKVPVLGKVVNHPTTQKVIKGSGTVDVVTRLLRLVPVPAIQQATENPIVRAGIAYGGGGGPEAALFQYATDKGILDNLGSLIPFGQQQQTSNGNDGSAEALAMSGAA